jgi:hypothetical protein
MGLMHAAVTKFRFSLQNKKSEAELNFAEKMRLLREKPTIVAFLKYRLSSALLDFEGAIWNERDVFWCFDLSFVERARGDAARRRCLP